MTRGVGRGLRHTTGTALGAALVAALGMAGGGTALLGAQEAPGPPRARVVILHSFTPDLGVVERDIRTWLRDSARSPMPEVHMEHLDLVRFGDPASRRLLRRYLGERYARRRPDLIVAAYGPALDLLAREGADFLPEVPRLAVGLNAGEMPAGTPRPPGIYLPSTLERTLALVRRLQPRVERLVVVGGASAIDTAYVSLFIRFARRFEPTIPILRVDGTWVDDATRRLAALGPRDAVLFVTWLGDPAGRPERPEDIVARLARAARAPTYVFLDDYLVPGTLGGIFVPSSELAAATARLIDAALRGDTIARTARELPAHPVFRWDALPRWELGDATLPRDAIVRGRPPSLWRTYRPQVLAALAILVGQAATIVALVVARRRERRAEAAEQEARLQLVHLGRVATLGELTASLAHELRQPLTAVRVNATTALEVLRRAPESTALVGEIVGEMDRHATRADHIIERLRTLFRNDGWNPRPLELNPLVESVLSLLARDVASRRAQLQLDLAPAPLLVAGDEVQLHQLLMNLVLNAAEAMTETTGPRMITVRTRAAGDTVQLEVDDTGPGVPATQRERVFEPFVTGKPEGMGMGLALVRSVARAHGGTVTALDGPGGGARFRVTLPRTAGSVAPPVQPPTAGGTGSTTPSASRS